MEIKVGIDFVNKRLDNFVLNAFFEEYSSITGENLTRSIVQKNIKDMNIRLNGKIAKPSLKLHLNDTVKFDIQKKEDFILTPSNIPLDILYEDDCLIVLNKQKNLICHPTSQNKENTLVNALLFHTDKLSDIGGSLRPGIVHRLDKDTSGLMLAAKTNEAHIKLQKDIQDKKTVRKYLAVCHGVINEDAGTVDKPLVHYLNKTIKMNVSDEGQRAVTHYKVLERFNNATLLELKLETGRTHQIRCHLAYLNHPLIGDELYGAKAFKTGIFKNLKTEGQVLISYYLSFTHPHSFEIMRFELKENDWHSDLKRVLNLLRSIE